MNWPLADDALTATRDAFGVAVVYQPQSGPAEPITAIFDEFAQPVASGGMLEVVTATPLLSVRLDDLTATPAPGDTFVAEGRTWSVRSAEPDGLGGVDMYAFEVT